MRLKFLVLALPALVLVALLVGGCGGGGGGGSTTKTTIREKAEPKQQLGKAEFIAQGDGICGEVNTAIGSVEESAAEPSSQTTQVANLYIGMVESLQRLGRPSPATGYSEFMGAAEKLALVEGEVKKASEAEEGEALEAAAQEAVPAVENFQSEAAVYGFEQCAEEPHAPERAPESSTGGVEEAAPEESGGVEVLPEEVAPEEEFVPEEEIAPEEEVAPETGGAGGGIEEVAPEEAAPEEGGESGGIGPG